MYLCHTTFCTDESVSTSTSSWPSPFSGSHLGTQDVKTMGFHSNSRSIQLGWIQAIRMYCCHLTQKWFLWFKAVDPEISRKCISKRSKKNICFVAQPLCRRRCKADISWPGRSFPRWISRMASTGATWATRCTICGQIPLIYLFIYIYTILFSNAISYICAHNIH